uniref:L1 transposable element RRM domain-containing protein n=1 Tax=Rhinolophus ferrumequinum TaxID=59479 RepID=A0A671DN93_RHIFE
MFKELREDIKKDVEIITNELRENIKKDVEIITKNQLELKNTITEIKNSLEGITSRLDEAEDRISDLEDKAAEITQTEQQKEKRIKNNEDGLRDLWDNIKRNNMRIIGIPEGEESKQGIENIFEVIMFENFPNLMKETNIQVQEVQRVPTRINPNRSTPRHIIVKMAKLKDKERILKAARERQRVTYKGTPIRLSNDFSTETLKARREWQEILKVMENKGLQPRLLYPARLSFKVDGEIKKERSKQPNYKFKNGNIYVPINNHFKCKWIKCSNQKT